MLTGEKSCSLASSQERPDGLLRCHWHLIALAQGLSDENPTELVLALDEDLLLLRDKSGKRSLIGTNRCGLLGLYPHASSFPEEGGVEDHRHPVS